MIVDFIDRHFEWIGLAIITLVTVVMVTALLDESNIRDGIATRNAMEALYHAGAH